ncbi:MAG: hypothetical protein AVDCRST_MAG12-424, partial [uncultured Rubrobacteraceae bacterium]
ARDPRHPRPEPDRHGAPDRVGRGPPRDGCRPREGPRRPGPRPLPYPIQPRRGPPRRPRPARLTPGEPLPAGGAGDPRESLGGRDGGLREVPVGQRQPPAPAWRGGSPLPRGRGGPQQRCQARRSPPRLRQARRHAGDRRSRGGGRRPRVRPLGGGGGPARDRRHEGARGGAGRRAAGGERPGRGNPRRGHGPARGVRAWI